MNTLAELQTAVDSWLMRDDVALGTDWGQVLAIAESNIANDVRSVAQEVTTSLVFTGRSADLPADFLEIRDVYVSGNKIEFMTPQALRESPLWVSGRSGAFYTLEGGGKDVSEVGDDRVALVIAAAATPASPLTVEVKYFRRFPALTLATDTNWLLKNHFDVYLYAALRVGCEYIGEETLEDRYAVKYAKAVSKIARNENRKRYGAVPKRPYSNPRGIV